MRKLVLILTFSALASMAGAVELHSFETYGNGTQQEIFGSSGEVEFRLNVSDDQDYNITLVSPSGRVVKDQPMKLQSSDFYFIYGYNHSLDSPTSGDWKASVNFTTTDEEKLVSEGFHVASDTPGFYDLRSTDYVRVGENGTVSVKVTDTGDDVQSVSLESDNDSYQMTLVEDEQLYDVYKTEAKVDEQGENSYNITAEDSGGLTSRIGFSIYGYSNDEKTTSVNVKVKNSCLVVLNDFYAPKNGSLFVGQTGYFTEELGNVGSLTANVTIKGLNVTYEGNNSWDPGEDIGPQVVSYDGENYTNVREGDQVVYNRFYTRSNRSGWYTGRSEFNASCYYRGETFKLTDRATVNFNVVNASGGVSTSGNKSTNQTIVSNVNHTSTEDTNQTLEQKANQTGETGQNVEGNNAQPGVTPQPEPEPEPEPTPMLSLDMESVKTRYTGPRGSTIRANISLTNEGDETLSELTVSPQIQKFRENWAANDASVASLGINQTVYREIILQTPASADSGLYVVPIVGSNAERELDLDYFTVELTKQVENRSRMEIVEAPSSLNVRQNSSTSLPILINNTGETPLTNVTGSFQNLKQCGIASVETIERIPVNSSESMSIRLKAAETTQSCNTTLIVSSDQGAYSFSKVNFTVRPAQGLIPEKYRVPFIAFAWTGLLAVFALMRNRYHPNSALFKAPFVMIVAGEALIFLYLTADYYQLVQLSFLPF